MRILVLGGTVFLSRAIAEAAVAAGHEVTCAARGTSGSTPDGAHLVTLDRAAPDWSPLGGEWDAVLDVARTPSWVGAALDALAERAAHWTFVSSISAYADTTSRGGSPPTLTLHRAALDDDADYGPAKVGCEQLLARHAAAPLIVRPGLIVGPGDPTGRFGYWPERLADPGPVLAPGHPDRLVQVIDVRDLAAWLVRCVEVGTTGTLDVSAAQLTMLSLLGQVAHGVAAAPDLVWIDDETLANHDVRPWSGPRSLPLWLPPALAGMLDHDVSDAYAAGLTTRPLAETTAETLAWLRAHPEAARTGLTRAEEAAALHSVGYPTQRRRQRISVF